MVKGQQIHLQDSACCSVSQHGGPGHIRSLCVNMSKWLKRVKSYRLQHYTNLFQNRTTLNLTFCPLFLTDRNAWAQVKRCQTCQWQQDRHRKGDPETSLQGPGYCRGGGEFPFHFSWTIMCRDDALSSFTLTHSFFTYLFLCHHVVLSPQSKKVPAQSHENIVKLWA